MTRDLDASIAKLAGMDRNAAPRMHWRVSYHGPDGVENVELVVDAGLGPDPDITEVLSAAEAGTDEVARVSNKLRAEGIDLFGADAIGGDTITVYCKSGKILLSLPCSFDDPVPFDVLQQTIKHLMT